MEKVYEVIEKRNKRYRDKYFVCKKIFGIPFYICEYNDNFENVLAIINYVIFGACLTGYLIVSLCLKTFLSLETLELSSLYILICYFAHLLAKKDFRHFSGAKDWIELELKYQSIQSSKVVLKYKKNKTGIEIEKNI